MYFIIRNIFIFILKLNQCIMTLICISTSNAFYMKKEKMLRAQLISEEKAPSKRVF